MGAPPAECVPERYTSLTSLSSHVQLSSLSRSLSLKPCPSYTYLYQRASHATQSVYHSTTTTMASESPFPPLAAIYLTHFDDTKGQTVLYYKSANEDGTSLSLIHSARSGSKLTSGPLQHCHQGLLSTVHYPLDHIKRKKTCLDSDMEVIRQ